MTALKIKDANRKEQNVVITPREGEGDEKVNE